MVGTSIAWFTLGIFTGIFIMALLAMNGGD